ncbi:MAG: GAF domain-containing protein [Betaproteobacteria bacterium]
MVTSRKAKLTARPRKRRAAAAPGKAERADLTRLLAESRAQRAATAEILRVIARSPADLQPTFKAILRSTTRVCESSIAALFLLDHGVLTCVAHHNTTPTFAAVLQKMRTPPSSETPTRLAALERKVIHVRDYLNDKRFLPLPDQSRESTRTVLSVPLLRNGALVGVITTWRRKVRPFAARHIALLRSFADHAVIAIENVRLFNETKEALERQTATSDILVSISSSMTDTQPVFDAIVRTLRRLFGTRFSVLQILRGDMVEMPAVDGVGIERLRERYPRPIDETTVGGRAMLTKQPVQFAPVLDNPATPEATIQFAKDFGFNSVIFTPMIHEGRVVGAIGAARSDARPFDERQVALIKTFADQAVIAIENVRLFNETRESLERQTATAEILKVISSSPTDVQPVFEAIVASGMKLFSGAGLGIGIVNGEEVVIEAAAGMGGVGRGFRMPLSRDSASGLAILERKLVNIVDTEAPGAPPHARENGRRLGIRSMTQAPMFREGEPIGSIGVMLKEPGGLDDKQLALLGTFADQAVIAIENARLFNETKEALERQTATAEILKVIASSPSDVQPVFEAIAESAKRILGGHSGMVLRFDGEQLHFCTVRSDQAGQMQFMSRYFPVSPVGEPLSGRCVLERVVVETADLLLDPDPRLREIAGGTGVRAVLVVPMLREGQAIGTISVARLTAGAFSEAERNLLTTFADQAVIAIENVRLFNETKEALERQTATAEILKVISGSPTDTKPVFDAIAASCVRLFGGLNVALVLARDREVDLAAFATPDEIIKGEFPDSFPLPISEESVSGRAILTGEVIHVPDMEADPRLNERSKSVGRRFGYRNALCAPMLREGKAIGAIAVVRAESGGFSEKQIALLKTFADQAVIAIENVRLFKELQAQTEALTRSVGQLTALGEVGQAISSTLDLETVLQTIVSRAVQLTGMDAGSIYEYDEQAEVYRLKAAEKMAPELVEAVRQTPIRKGDGATGRTAVTLEPVPVADIQDESYQGSRKDNLMRTGYRAVLAVPLLREGHLLGALQVFRRTPGEFAPEVVELLKTFATQSAMAMQNARLFREIAEKGRELEEASRHKSNFLASMSHELRTPLNAILGFNEMILGQVYGEVPADMQEPLTDIQTSGKHLLRLINNVLDLAKIEAGRMELSPQDYSVHDTVGSVHSTLRPLAAEKGLEFLATLPEDLPLAFGDAGRIAQCLMNLAGNSLKFTKAGRVEISVVHEGDLLRYSVADTGIGIPPDKIGSLFTEFKQTDATIASEYGGTGLGLSITRKFIEMHRGRIWIESELGKGSAFIFEIPLRFAP